MVLVLALITLGLGAGWQASKNPGPVRSIETTVAQNQPGLYQVTRIDDGDTIVVNQGGTSETVRLIGIDTPEVKDPRKPVQCYGPQASDETKHLLSGQRVRLEPDPIGDNRDKYHRLLRYVYLPDGTFINQLLISRGFAFVYTIFPFQKLDDFKAAQTQARQSQLGLWSACRVDESSDILQTNPL